ncbi:ATP-binding cassette domain-containing protein [Kitasatospora sp. NPDC054939]
MIQITGLTKVYRRGVPPTVLDLTFDARPGLVTALLGPEGSGKSTALRLMLELERGQGVTLFDGRTYRRLRRPEREVGVLLPDPGPGSAVGDGTATGHPGRTARGHLRMLAAAVGVPVGRADELLEQTRLATVAEQRLRAFSPGMHRRLALAAALLGDPRTLLLDAPTEGLSPRNVEWFHSFLRSFAVAGGTVLVTTRTPQEAARLADRVVTLDQGRLMADQPVTEFRRTRLSPEVAVRGPQMARLADLLVGQGAEVRRDGGAGLAVSGVGRTEIGELAYRHGILLHELADRVVEQPAPRAVLPAASGRSGHLQVRRPDVRRGTHPETRTQSQAESRVSESRREARPETHTQTHTPTFAEPHTDARTQVDARPADLPTTRRTEAVPAPAADARPTAGTALPVPLPVPAAAPVPVSAQFPAPLSVPSPVGAAAGSVDAPGPRSAPDRGAASVRRTDESDTSPTVMVDRLFRKSATDSGGRAVSVPAHRTDGDTVRLGRISRQDPGLPTAPAPAGTHGPSTPTPSTPTPTGTTPTGTTPEQRSE